jgi:uncharacterized protein
VKRLDPGVGIVCTQGVDLVWDSIADHVDVIEVEPQIFWTADETADEESSAFDWIRTTGKPTICHGVAEPVATTDVVDADKVRRFARSCRSLSALWASEHLAFNAAGGQPAGVFLPALQTAGAVEAAVRNISRYQQITALPFLVENPVNYMKPQSGELSDGAFLAAVSERSDCGLLLDLHNALANERNGRQRVVDLIEELPLDRVIEIHVAGGFWHNGFYLDAHSGLPDDELLAHFEATIERVPNCRAVVFEVLPEFLGAIEPAALVALLSRLAELIRHRRVRQSDAADAEDWQHRLTAFVTGDSPVFEPDAAGAAVLRDLCHHARLGRLTIGGSDLLDQCATAIGWESVDRLVSAYCMATSMATSALGERDQFEEWLKESSRVCVSNMVLSPLQGSNDPDREAKQ